MKKKRVILITLCLVLILGVVGVARTTSFSKSKMTVAKELLVSDSGWSYVESDNGNYISYGAKLTSTYESTLIKSPIIKVTGKDELGRELFSFEDELAFISPKETLYFGKTFKVEEKPAKIDIIVEAEDTDFVPANGLKYIKNNELSVADSTEIDNNDFKEYTGNIRNSSTSDLTKSFVTIIYRKDGKIVGGTYSYVYSIGASSKTAFDIYSVNTPDYDDYEISVISNDNIK